MRALLVVNPAATTTSARTRDVLIHALASEMKLDVVTTEYRGHARRPRPRRPPRPTDMDLVVALGGDGTVNEVVNGLLHHGPDPTGLPRLAVVPGGSHQRLRPRPRAAQRRRGGHRRPAGRAARRTERTVGLGSRPAPRAPTDEAVPARWFTFCAGLGFDAEVIGRVEQQRERGKRSTHALYMRQAVRQFLTVPAPPDGRRITLERRGSRTRSRASSLSIVCNTSSRGPTSAIGRSYASRRPSFDTGLDVCSPLDRLAHRDDHCDTAAHLQPRARRPHGKHARRAARPDGLHLAFAGRPCRSRWTETTSGLRTSVTFTGVRRALRVIV